MKKIVAALGLAAGILAGCSQAGLTQVDPKPGVDIATIQRYHADAWIADSFNPDVDALRRFHDDAQPVSTPHSALQRMKSEANAK